MFNVDRLVSLRLIRSVIIFSLLALVSVATSAQDFAAGHRRIFDYPQVGGIALDWCVTWGTNCGQPAADNFCRTQGYQRTIGFLTYTPGRTNVAGQICEGNTCGAFSRVECDGPVQTPTVSQGNPTATSSNPFDPPAVPAGNAPIGASANTPQAQTASTPPVAGTASGSMAGTFRSADFGTVTITGGPTAYAGSFVNSSGGTGNFSVTANPSRGTNTFSGTWQGGSDGGALELVLQPDNNVYGGWNERRSGNGSGSVWTRTSAPPSSAGNTTIAGAGGGQNGVYPVPLANGVPVDGCATWSANCGQPSADQFCRTQGFAAASAWNWAYDQRTFVLGSNQYCDTGPNVTCGGLRDVVCVGTGAYTPPVQTAANPPAAPQPAVAANGPIAGTFNSVDFGTVTITGGPDVYSGSWIKGNDSGTFSVTRNPARGDNAFSGTWDGGNGYGGALELVLQPDNNVYAGWNERRTGGGSGNVWTRIGGPQTASTASVAATPALQPTAGAGPMSGTFRSVDFGTVTITGGPEAYNGSFVNGNNTGSFAVTRNPARGDNAFSGTWDGGNGYGGTLELVLQPDNNVYAGWNERRTGGGSGNVWTRTR